MYSSRSAGRHNGTHQHQEGLREFENHPEVRVLRLAEQLVQDRQQGLDHGVHLRLVGLLAGQLIPRGDQRDGRVIEELDHGLADVGGLLRGPTARGESCEARRKEGAESEGGRRVRKREEGQNMVLGAGRGGAGRGAGEHEP